MNVKQNSQNLSLFDDQDLMSGMNYQAPDLSYPDDEKWCQLLDAFFEKDAGKNVKRQLEVEQSNQACVFPHDVFRALKVTPFSKVKVVILGQDPYHDIGQADGLAFSVQPGTKVPPSLRNIKKELNREFGCPITEDGHLIDWSKQGVLLLNTVLTVRAHEAASHRDFGWQALTDSLIQALADDPLPKVFMLWGNMAKAKRVLIDENKHFVLTSNHPSPLAALRKPDPFIGNNHFELANKWLVSQNQSAIEWKI